MEHLTPNGAAIQITPFMAMLTVVVIGLMIRDYATKIARGLTFSFNKTFREGDKVLLDNETAIIVKVGLTQTVFGITKESGDYIWRYVPNERIVMLKLEKIIFTDNS